MIVRLSSGRRLAGTAKLKLKLAAQLLPLLVVVGVAATYPVGQQRAAAPVQQALARVESRKEPVVLPSNTLAGLDPFQQKLLKHIARDTAQRLRPGVSAKRDGEVIKMITSGAISLPTVCFAPGTPQDTVDEFYANREPSVPLFRVSSNWTTTATNGSGITLGTPVTLTWSFLPDGTNIPGGATLGAGEPAAASNLIARLNTLYGSQAVWQPLFQQVFDRWAELTGVRYVYQATDDGATFPTSAGSLGVRGDMRIGGHFIDGNSNILAYNFYPNTGDMVIDTADNFYDTVTGNSLRLRNVLAHEHGHGLGFAHVCPVNQTKLMEPFASTSFDGPQLDDIMAGQRAYGDTDESNETSGTATNLGTLGDGTVTRSTRSVDDDSDVDFYRFTAAATGRKVSITLTPTGATYLEGSQNANGSCTAGSSFNSLTLNDIGFELRDTNGTTVLSTRNANAAGIVETLSDYVLAGTGPYYIRIFGGSANNVQMYSLQLTLAESIPQPPVIDLNGSNGSGNDFSTTFTEAAGATLVADTDALVTDADNSNLASLTATLASRPDGNGVESLSATVSGTSITASYTASTGVLSLSGSDTVANYQQVLRTIAYNNTSQTPTTTSRTVTLVANDGVNNSSTVTSTIAVVAANSAPTVTLPGGALNYTENDSATIIDSGATVGDVDSANFDTGTLTVNWSAGGQTSDRLAIRNQGNSSGEIGVSGADVSYSGTVIGSVTGGSGTTALVITFNANTIPTAAQALARNVTYANVSDSPPTATRTVRFVITDGDGGTSTAATKAVNLTAVNDAPVVDLNDSGSGIDTVATFTEASGPIAIAGSATVVDVDSTNLVSMTVTLVSRPDGNAAEALAANTGGTSITASYTASTGALSLTGSDTLARYQQVLRSVTYNNSSQNPTTGARSVSVVGNDGSAVSGTATSTVSVAAVNTAPTVTLPGSAFTYTENGPAAIIDASATVADTDSANFDSGSLTVSWSVGGQASDRLAIRNQGTGGGQIGVSGADVSFGGTVIGTFTGGSGTTALVVSFNTNATPAAAQALARNITYSNVSEAPPTAARTVQFVVADGDGGTGAAATKSVTVIAVNDAPVVDLNDGGLGIDTTASFTEGGGSAVLANGAVISDLDSANLASLTVTLTTRPDGNATESLSANTAGTSITASYTASTGVLSLSGSDTLAHYQQVLRTIAYNNSSQNPTTTARSVTVVGNDGSDVSAAATVSITVTAVNNAPVLTLPGGALGYTENDGPTIIDSGATVTDADSANFNTGTLTVSWAVGGQINDRLAIRNQGTGAGQIGISGTDVTHGGTIIGTFVGGSGTTALVVSLNTNASPAVVQSLSRNITYANISETPATSPRTVQFVVTDGDGGTSTAVTKAINVTAVADAPVVDLNDSGSGIDSSASFTEDAGAIVLAGNAVITDLDSSALASLTVTLTTRPDGDATEVLVAVTTGTGITASYTAATGVLSLTGSDTLANYQQVLRSITYDNTSQAPSTSPRSVTVVANDGDVNSATATATISLTAVNDAPDITLPGAALAYTENDAPTIIDSGTTVSDIDSANFDTGSVTVSLTAGGEAADRLAVRNQGTATGEIGLSGADVTYGSTVIGTFTGGSGTTALVVTFNAAATPAAVQALARNIAYANVSEAPSTSPRTIQFVVTDGDGGTSLSATKTVNVTEVNDPPNLDLNGVVSGTDTTTSFTEGGGAVTVAASAVVGDVDNNMLASATVTLTNQPDGVAEELGFDTTGTDILGLYDSGVLTFTGVDTVAHYQQVLRSVTYNNTLNSPDTTPRAITFIVDDGDDESAVATATVTLIAVNDAPSFTLPGNPAASDEDGGTQQVAGFATAISAGPVDEADQELTFNLGVTSTTGTLAFSSAPAIDSTTGQLTYTAAANTFGTALVSVTLSDNGGTANNGSDTSAAQTFTITVNPIVDTPTVTDTTTNEDTLSANGLVITPNAADGAEVTHFKVSGLTNGLLYLAEGTTSVANNSFITTAQGAAGLRFRPAANLHSPGSSFGFNVQAATGNSDGLLGGSVMSATITVASVNDTPTTSGLTGIVVGQAVASSTVGLFDAFADIEDADTALTYTVTGNSNPSLITSTSINSTTGELTLNYAPSVAGSATITVRATDTGELFVATTLTVTRQTGLSLSGRIADVQGMPIEGVTVSRGAGGPTVLTNGAGYYTFFNLPAGSFTITPTKSNYTFAPVSRSVTLTTGNVASQNFTGTTGYTISGRISNSAGVQIAGVTISRTGSATTVVSNSAGYYTFISVQPGSYTLTPSKAGYRFTPASKTIGITNANVSGHNFIGATGYNISGRIANSSGIGQPNISVRRSGSSVAVLTNGAGYYTFTDVPNGSVTITPSAAGTSFAPELRTVTMNSSDISGYNFTLAPGFNVIGRITNSSGIPIAGISVTRTGSTISVVTNGAGYFVFAGVPNGSYVLTPSLSGSSFTPATRTATVSSADALGQNFIVIGP